MQDDSDYSNEEEEDYVDETALHTTMPTHKSPSHGYKNTSLRSRGGAEEAEVLRQRLEKVEAVSPIYLSKPIRYCTVSWYKMN